MSIEARLRIRADFRNLPLSLGETRLDSFFSRSCFVSSSSSSYLATFLIQSDMTFMYPDIADITPRSPNPYIHTTPAPRIHPHAILLLHTPPTPSSPSPSSSPFTTPILTPPQRHSYWRTSPPPLPSIHQPLVARFLPRHSASHRPRRRTHQRRVSYR